MSIQYADNFQFYGSTSNMLGGTPWANVYTGSGGGIAADPDGVSPGDVLRIATSAIHSSKTRLVVPSADAKVGVAFRWWFNGLPSVSTHSGAFLLKNASNGAIAVIYVTPTGQIVWANAVGAGTIIDNTGELTTVEESGPLVFTPGAWNHVEVMLDIDTGDYELRVEGVTILSGNDAAAGSADIGIVEWTNSRQADSGGSSTGYIKDLVVWDGTGTQNNNFVGPVQVIALPVNADVSSGWTRSGGSTDYELLDEINPNDSDYIEADETPPAPSIMEFEDLPPEIIGVRALMSIVRNLKTDGGDATLQVSLRYNSADDPGADEAVQISPTYQWSVSELNPDTGQLWAPAEVDSAQIVIDRTS